MGYCFNNRTGKVGIFELSKTEDGWIPYWNLDGRFVGLRLPEYTYQPSVYYNPSTRDCVETYEELDWWG